MASTRQQMNLADSPMNIIVFLVMVIVALLICVLEGDSAKSLQNTSYYSDCNKVKLSGDKKFVPANDKSGRL